KLKVTSVNFFTGAITGVSVVQPGLYTVEPANPVSVTDAAKPLASGAAFDLTFANTAGDVFAVPTGTGVPGAVTPTAGPPFQLPYDTTTLPLIIPGPQVSGTSVDFNAKASPTATDNLVLNGTNNGIDVTFDRNIQAATFT